MKRSCCLAPAALVALGILIAVVLGAGAETAQADGGQRTTQGADASTLLVMPGAATSGGVNLGNGRVLTLTPQDAAAIATQCSAVAVVAPVVRARTQVSFGKHNWVPLYVYGTTPAFLEVRDWADLAEGKLFTDADVRNGNRVCVIGRTIKHELFQDQSPVGREVRIQNVSFRVIGVLSERGANMMGLDQDDVVLAPWTTIKARINTGTSAKPNQGAATKVNSLNQSYPGTQTNVYPSQAPLRTVDYPQQTRFTNIDQILVRARSAQQVPLAQRQITDLLRERHRLKPGQSDDFTVRKFPVFPAVPPGGLGNSGNKKPQPGYRTTAATRGRLVATIHATGTLQPEEMVDVGAQIAGPIVAFGKGITWGAAVDQGTVLAQIDDARYKSKVNVAKEMLAQAKAELSLKTAKADLAKRDLDRAKQLIPRGGMSRAEYDQYVATYKAAEISVEVAKAAVAVSETNLREAETDLNYTTIRSPIKGVIIDRRVIVGQMVAPNLAAPSLFVIASDLGKMEVLAAVNEADVSKIKVGQNVNFSVTAFPGREFTGKVVPQGQFAARLNASTSQNMVTYTVVVSVDNKDGSLLPFLTADLSFVVAEKKDALLVPNAALRWRPAPEQIVPEARAAYFKIRTAARDRGFVWVQAGKGQVQPIQVRTGISDGVHTEILEVVGDGELRAGTVVVIGPGPDQY